MQKVIITDQNDANQRIDKFLKKFFPNATLGVLYKMLRTGKIQINGEKVPQNHRVSLHDEIEIFVREQEVTVWKTEQKSPNTTPLDSGDFFEILYRDEYLLILNKPAGINVHP